MVQVVIELYAQPQQGLQRLFGFGELIGAFEYFYEAELLTDEAVLAVKHDCLKYAQCAVLLLVVDDTDVYVLPDVLHQPLQVY